MPSPAVMIEYEASDIQPDFAGENALLVMATDKGRVAVYMRRKVLENLIDQIKTAREHEASSARKK